MKPEKSKKENNLTEKEILTTLLSEMTGAIDPNKVFYVGSNTAGEIIYKLAGKKLTPVQSSLLRNEAQMISKMQLWKIMTETLRNTARLKMFEKSETFDDMRWGKAMLYNVDVMETIVNKLQEIQPEKPKTHVYEPRNKAPTETQ